MGEQEKQAQASEYSRTKLLTKNVQLSVQIAASIVAARTEISRWPSCKGAPPWQPRFSPVPPALG